MAPTVNWPQYLPQEDPGTYVFDGSGTLSDAQISSLNAQCKSLPFQSRIVLLKEDFAEPVMLSFIRKLEAKWQVSNKFVLAIDMKSHAVMTVPNSEGAIFDGLYDKTFAPEARSGDIYQALSHTLSAMSKTWKDTGLDYLPSQRADSKNTSTSSADEQVHMLGAFSGWAFFIVIIAIVAMVIHHRRKGTRKFDLKQERQKFKDLMVRLETLSQTRPNLYMLQVAALSVVGYVYIWLVLLLLAVLAMLTLVLLIKLPFLAIKAGIPLLLLIGVILRSFWLKEEPIPGIHLKKKDYPELFNFVDSIRKQILAPPVHEIVVDPTFNAAVIQKARLGLLGFHKNYLLIGMPLIQAFSQEQFKAVLAHELGHLAGRHSANLAWIYHVRTVYAQLIQRLSEHSTFGQGLFRAFLGWYVPYFDAYSFALRRTQEHYADEFAVELVGRHNAAAMLIGTDLKAAFLVNKYWTDVYKGARIESNPPLHVYSQWPGAVNRNIKVEDAQTWLMEALNRKTDYDDSHPSPTDRLARVLGIPASEVAEYARANVMDLLHIERSAAEALFGAKLSQVVDRLDAQWTEEIRPLWQHQYAVYQEWRKDLATLEEKELTGQLNDEELVTLAARTAQLKDFAEAQPHFIRALSKVPEDAALNQVYGEWLLDEKDPDCVSFLEQAMKLDRTRTLACCQLLYGWMMSQGKEDEADRYSDLVSHWMEEYTEYAKERAGVYPEDQYKEHGLDESKIKELTDQLRDFPEVQHAYILEKEVKHFPEAVLYVVVFDFKVGLFTGTDVIATYIDRVSRFISYPGEALVLYTKNAPARLKQAIKTFESAQIM